MVRIRGAKCRNPYVIVPIRLGEDRSGEWVRTWIGIAGAGSTQYTQGRREAHAEPFDVLRAADAQRERTRDARDVQLNKAQARDLIRRAIGDAKSLLRTAVVLAVQIGGGGVIAGDFIAIGGHAAIGLGSTQGARVGVEVDRVAQSGSCTNEGR